MKTKFVLTMPNRLILGAAFVILTSAVPTYAASCVGSTTFDQLTTCTLGPGNIITFSNFQSTLPGNSVIAVSLNTPSSPGSVGFTFSSLGGTSLAYTFSYTATCSAACIITGGSDSSSGFGNGTYNYTIGGNASGGTSTVFNTTFPGTASITNTGSYVSGGTSQSITLDVNFIPAIITATPEPASFALIGGALVALGMVARGRKRPAAPKMEQTNEQPS